MNIWRSALAFGVGTWTSAALFAQQATPQVKPLGSEASTKLKTLSAGSQMLQTQLPPSQLNAYLVGFHPMKSHPGHQMEAHHFCRQVNEDLAQCALFDGNTADANLNGIEYIISEKLFLQLPAEERQYWHPHNFDTRASWWVPVYPRWPRRSFSRPR